jgi:hypothetical protein
MSGIIETYASGVNGFLQSDIAPVVGVRAGSRTNYDFYLATNNVNRMVIKASGNVGVNTSSPAYPLDVNGIINATSIYINGSPFAGGGSQWTTSGTNIFYNAAGAVGIGTATPGSSYKLDVGGVINATGLSVNGTPIITSPSQWTSSGSNIYYNSAGSVGIGTSAPSSNYKLDIGGNLNISGLLFLNGVPFSPNPSQWTTSGINIYYNALGSVGIGTATPGSSYKLDVAGALNASSISINGVPFTSGGSQWTTSGSNIYYNVTSGVVGIGTATPNSTYKLDVGGPVNATGLYVNGTPFYGSQWVTSGTNISYTSAGSVSIGTTTPGSYKLAVAGKIAADGEVRVFNTGTTSFPDYVFDPSYKLQSLEEIENYVTKNHHLPEVPSAAEIEKNGMSLNDMNIILLKKVEELTLHLIEIKKEVEELRKREAELLEKRK